MGSELGRSPAFRPMRALRLQWSRAFSRVCEVALRLARPSGNGDGRNGGRKGRGRAVVICARPHQSGATQKGLGVAGCVIGTLLLRSLRCADWQFSSPKLRWRNLPHQTPSSTYNWNRRTNYATKSTNNSSRIMRDKSESCR